jgi:hypothetical protein
LYNGCSNGPTLTFAPVFRGRYTDDNIPGHGRVNVNHEVVQQYDTEKGARWMRDFEKDKDAYYDRYSKVRIVCRVSSGDVF